MTCALRQLRMKSRVILQASTVHRRLAALQEAAVEARSAAYEPSRHRAGLGLRLRQVTRRLNCPLAYERSLKTQRQEEPMTKTKTKTKANPLATSVHRLRKPAMLSARLHQPLPNSTLNRSANGWPPCPRGAVCLSCTSRARRPSVVARLALR